METLHLHTVATATGYMLFFGGGGVLLLLIAWGLARSAGKADRVVNEHDLRCVVPAAASEIRDPGSGIRDQAPETRTLQVLLEIEVHPTTRCEGLPMCLLDGQLMMLAARGARYQIEADTVGVAPLVSARLLKPDELRVPTSNFRAP